jgi:hypothetical protein
VLCMPPVVAARKTGPGLPSNVLRDELICEEDIPNLVGQCNQENLEV